MIAKDFIRPLYPLLTAPIFLSYDKVLILMMTFNSTKDTDEAIIKLLGWTFYIKNLFVLLLLLYMGFYISKRYNNSFILAATIGPVFGVIFFLTELIWVGVADSFLEYGNSSSRRASFSGTISLLSGDYIFIILKKIPIWVCITFIGIGIEKIIRRIRAIS